MITRKQELFYNSNKAALINGYLRNRPTHIDPDAIRDLFEPIGYDRGNVAEFKEISKYLTEDIYNETLHRNRDKFSNVVFACGLPATGKTLHLIEMAKDRIVYDGTINNMDKFIRFIQHALNLEYTVEVYIYSSQPSRAMNTNLERGDKTGRYVPISQYEKVAKSINERTVLLEHNFKGLIKVRNFEHTNFEAIPKQFTKIIIDRNELETIARAHRFNDHKTLQSIIRQ